MQRVYFARENSEILKIPIRKCSKSVVNFRNVNIWTPVEKGSAQFYTFGVVYSRISFQIQSNRSDNFSFFVWIGARVTFFNILSLQGAINYFSLTSGFQNVVFEPSMTHGTWIILIVNNQTVWLIKPVHYSFILTLRLEASRLKRFFRD